MASRRDEVLLAGEFMLLSKKRTPHKVTLTRCGLYYSSVSASSTSYEEKSVQVSDIIGCHSLDPTSDQTTTITNLDDEEDSSKDLGSDVEPTTPTTPTNIGIPKLLDPSTIGFTVFAYPLRKKVFSGKKVRHRLVLSFVLPQQQSNEVYEERRKKVEIWRNVINCLSRDIPVNDDSLNNVTPPLHGKILVLINPRSGPGKAHTIFKTAVQPMLHEASIPYKAVITEYSGHATDLLTELQLSEWYGVVIMSGDGLIFETINGIMSRGDWVSSIQTPIGCLPGGSGNALCCAINYAAGEPLNTNMALHSAFVLIKHRVVPMDLVIVHIPDRTIYSFLSVTWGIMADIDYESEKYRHLGEARFTVGALRRIIVSMSGMGQAGRYYEKTSTIPKRNEGCQELKTQLKGLRTYKGRVSFLPVAEFHPKEFEPSTTSNKKILSKIRSFSLRSRSSTKSTLNSSEESFTPQLLKHRSLSMDQSGYSEAQVYRSDIDFKQEIDTLAGGDLEYKPDSVVKNGLDHPPHRSKSEELGSRLSDPVTGSISSADITTSATDSVTNSNGNDQTDQSNTVVPNGSVSNDSNSETNVTVKINANGDDSINTGMNGNHNSTSKDNNGDIPSEINLKPPHVPGHQKSKSDVSFTVMSEAQEVKVERENYHGSKADFSPVPTPLLPPLDQPVPENWVTLEDDYVMVCAVYQTHLGSDLLAAPDAHLNDGFIHLMMVKEGISRNALLNLFLSFGQGGHIHSPFVTYVKVLAFRLEPLSSVGNIMIDGERFSPSALQAQILPGVAKIMAIQ